MRRVLGLLTVGLVVLGTLPAPAAAIATSRLSETTSLATGRLIVTVRSDEAPARIAALERILQRLGAQRAGPAVPQIGMVPVSVAGGGSVVGLARQLRAVPGVVAVEAERRLSLRYTPNDPALSLHEPAQGAPPEMPLEWWPAREGVTAAWDLTRGAGATVGIIDTGIDASHPEFAGRIVDSLDADAIPTHGPATTDDMGHGTHVSSLACGTGDNGTGLAGAGFGCSMLVVKTDLTEGSVAQGLVWATDHGAEAINMSFGSDTTRAAPDFLVKAIDYAYDHGVVLVAAAKDEAVEQQGYPADVLQPNGTGSDLAQGKGLTVTAANYYDQRASYAGFGSQVSLAAYGDAEVPNGPSGIFGAFPANHTELEDPSLIPLEPPVCGCRTSLNGDSRYAYLPGTSMAVPQVTATAALVKHVNVDLGAADIIRILKETARRPAGAVWTADLGWGILDAGAAIARAKTVDKRPPASRLRAPSRTRRTRFVVRWSGRDTALPGVRRSGIGHYEVWRARNGGKARRIAKTARTRLVVHGVRGSRYAYYTIAVDRAGNREAAPKRPDARVQVLRRRR